jgi:hypothetical protein
MPIVKEANYIKDIPQEWMAGFSTGWRKL